MFRSFIRQVFPNLYRRMEAESKTWMLQCPSCGHEESVWDRGGIRYKARGEAIRRGVCRGCGQTVGQRLYKS